MEKGSRNRYNRTIILLVVSALLVAVISDKTEASGVAGTGETVPTSRDYDYSANLVPRLIDGEPYLERDTVDLSDKEDMHWFHNERDEIVGVRRHSFLRRKLFPLSSDKQRREEEDVHQKTSDEIGMIDHKNYSWREEEYIYINKQIQNVTAGTNLPNNTFVEEHSENREGRVVGGQEVKPLDYPYLVSVIEKRVNGEHVHRCGGALVAKNAVLTAAHCSRQANMVRVGEHDRTRISESGTPFEEFEVEGKLIHPKYNPKTLDYDFAILVLKGESAFQPVLMNMDDTLPHSTTNLHVMGWGVYNVLGRHSNVPREAVVQALSNEECRRKYGEGMITNQMMCATGHRKDACRGDSGGPLIRKRGKYTGPDVLVGVVSWGYGCAHPNYPGVYARVSAISSWINQRMVIFGDGYR